MLDPMERELIDDWLQLKRSPEMIVLVILLMRSKTSRREREAVPRNFETLLIDVNMAVYHERRRLLAIDPRGEQESAPIDGG